MMPDYIEVRESYFKMPDGSVVMLRQIGDRLEWHGKVPVLFVEWAMWESTWCRLIKIPRAIIKEGPKSIVKWRA